MIDLSFLESWGNQNGSFGSNGSNILSRTADNRKILREIFRHNMYYILWSFRQIRNMRLLDSEHVLFAKQAVWVLQSKIFVWAKINVLYFVNSNGYSALKIHTRDIGSWICGRLVAWLGCRRGWSERLSGRPDIQKKCVSTQYLETWLVKVCLSRATQGLARAEFAYLFGSRCVQQSNPQPSPFLKLWAKGESTLTGELDWVTIKYVRLNSRY